MRRSLTLAALAGLVVFVATAIAMTAGATDRPDQALLMLFRPPGRPGELIGGPGLVRAMIVVTNLGGTLFLTVTSIAAGVWLLVRRRIDLTLYLAATMLLGTALRGGLKAAFARSRPDSVLHQVSVDTFSFPSGHATMSTIGYLTFGGLALRFAPPRLRTPIILAAVALPLAVGVTRVYLGVHWPSDVLAGWSVGTAWAALCALGYETWRRRAGLAA